MKLIIQIPCFNEEQTLPLVLKDIPKKIDGIRVIETQIIDDGSTDQTVEIARKLGVNHIISLPFNKGLGNAFKAGVENALKNKADILVNTDGDNQYQSKDIARLVRPILERQAEIVIGDRQTSRISHFSLIKKIFQKIGSGTVAFLAGVDVPDAVSGFRAYSREALFEINVTSEFSYVLDTVIQAAKKRIKIHSVPITTNPPTRQSRLFKNIIEHIAKSTINLIRVYVFYEPLKTFTVIGTIFLLFGLLPLLRFIIFYLEGVGEGHIQSLIVGSMFVIIGIQMYGLGIIGILSRKQNKLTEEILNRIKRNEYDK